METENKNTLSPVLADKSIVPTFDRRIFWDTDYEKLDFDRYGDFVITRVFERGDVEDIRQCRRYYGDKKLERVLVKATSLSLKTISLCCALFNNELTDYKCYTIARSNQMHWLY